MGGGAFDGKLNACFYSSVQPFIKRGISLLQLLFLAFWLRSSVVSVLNRVTNNDFFIHWIKFCHNSLWKCQWFGACPARLGVLGLTLPPSDAESQHTSHPPTHHTTHHTHDQHHAQSSFHRHHHHTIIYTHCHRTVNPSSPLNLLALT